MKAAFIALLAFSLCLVGCRKKVPVKPSASNSLTKALKGGDPIKGVLKALRIDPADKAAVIKITKFLSKTPIKNPNGGKDEPLIQMPGNVREKALVEYLTSPKGIRSMRGLGVEPIKTGSAEDIIGRNLFTGRDKTSLRVQINQAIREGVKGAKKQDAQRALSKIFAKRSDEIFKVPLPGKSETKANPSKGDDKSSTTARELTAEEAKLVGIYEGRYRIALRKDMAFELFHMDDGEKEGEGTWIVKNGEVKAADASGTEIWFLRIEANDSLTLVAREDNGKREDHPKDEQLTFKKIK